MDSPELDMVFRWCVGTIQKGFRLWHQNGRFIKTLELPNTVRNVNKSWGVSNSLVMSKHDVYAIAGIRYYCYFRPSSTVKRFIHSRNISTK